MYGGLNYVFEAVYMSMKWELVWRQDYYKAVYNTSEVLSYRYIWKGENQLSFRFRSIN